MFFFKLNLSNLLKWKLSTFIQSVPLCSGQSFLNGQLVNDVTHIYESASHMSRFYLLLLFSGQVFIKSLLVSYVTHEYTSQTSRFYLFLLFFLNGQVNDVTPIWVCNAFPCYKFCFSECDVINERSSIFSSH